MLCACYYLNQWCGSPQWLCLWHINIPILTYNTRHCRQSIGISNLLTVYCNCRFKLPDVSPWSVCRTYISLGSVGVSLHNPNVRDFSNEITLWKIVGIYTSHINPKCIGEYVSIKISLKFVSKGPIDNIPALVQTMAWHRSGDKPLFEPVMVSLATHICVNRPQWVNWPPCIAWLPYPWDHWWLQWRPMNYRIAV